MVCAFKLKTNIDKKNKLIIFFMKNLFRINTAKLNKVFEISN